jgi:hypothetical protein
VDEYTRACRFLQVLMYRLELIFHVSIQFKKCAIFDIYERRVVFFGFRVDVTSEVIPYLSVGLPNRACRVCMYFRCRKKIVGKNLHITHQSLYRHGPVSDTLLCFSGGTKGTDLACHRINLIKY